MNIYLEDESNFKTDLDIASLFDEVVKVFVSWAKIPYEVGISVVLTNNESIREINRENRGIDNPTDVLSFPALEFDTPGDFSFISDKTPDAFDLDTGDLYLGDVVISLERAKAQAEEYGHSFKRELAFLLVHSLLHLSGYDHMEEDERLVMEEKQREILEILKITRD